MFWPICSAICRDLIVEVVVVVLEERRVGIATAGEFDPCGVPQVPGGGGSRITPEKSWSATPLNVRVVADGEAKMSRLH